MRLSIEGASVELGGRSVLRDVTLSFQEAAVTGVLGPNGAGKSTLLRALGGLIPLAKGCVRVGDHDLSALPRRDIARKAAYLAQATDVSFPFRVEDVVLMGRYAHLRRFQQEGPDDLEIVERALRIVDAGRLKGRAVNELSGGERQRVVLARTLATEAPVLLLDEPVANLDIRHSLDLLEILRSEARSGRTAVVAIHDLNLAYRHCDRFVLLHEGRVLAEGPCEEVLRPELLRTAFEVETKFLNGNGQGHFVFTRRSDDGQGLQG